MIRTSLSSKKLARFRRLPAAERRLLLRASAWLLAVDLGLRLLGFGRLRRLLARGAAPVSDAAEDPGAAAHSAAVRWPEVEAVAWAVAAAARHHLYPMPCLTRALVLQRFLVRRGVPAELRIGVGKVERELSAHAWVECGGRPVAEPEDVRRRFAPLHS